MHSLITFTLALLLTVLTVTIIGLTLGGLTAIIYAITGAPLVLCYSLDLIDSYLNKGF